jgi:hypothetical protein
MKITRYIAFEPLLLVSRKGLAIWKTSFCWSGMSACYLWFCQSPMFTREAIHGSLHVACIWFGALTFINCFTFDDEKEKQDKLLKQRAWVAEENRKFFALMNEHPHKKKFWTPIPADRKEQDAPSLRDSDKLP